MSTTATTTAATPLDPTGDGPDPTEDAVAAGPDVTELPTRFSMVTPADWITLPLDPETRDARITRLVERQLGRGDAIAHLRRQTTLLLRDVAADAHQRGAFFATTVASVVDGRPLSASMLAFVAPLGDEGDGAGPPRDVQTMADRLATGPAGDDGLPPDEVSVVELGIGPAVRVRRRGSTGLSGSDGRTVVAETLVVHVPLADRAHQLVLAFSTPILPLADAMVDLFDAMALTVRWRTDGPAAPAGETGEGS